MKRILYLIIFLSISSYSQSKIDKLINQVSNDVIPEDFNYYYLLENSLQDKKANDSIDPFFPKTKRELLESNPDFSFELLSKLDSKSINWRKYNLEKVKFITEKETANITNISKELYFIISNPIFSKNERYARISVLEQRRNQGECIAYIYEYKNEVWKKIAEVNQYAIRVSTVH